MPTQPRERIRLKDPKEIAGMRAAGKLVAECFAALHEAVRPGIALSELDRIVTDLIDQHGAQPLYKDYRGNPPSHPPFPGVICASVNSEICHGLPDGRVLKEGDIVGVDIGLKYNDFCGDACVTYAVGKISQQTEKLLEVSRECLQLGIEAARAGSHLSDIGMVIEEHAKKFNFSVVREWGGHGIGRNLHEAPSVPHTGPGGLGPILLPGMVFTIEPMVNAGRPEWKLLKDGWTVVTRDGSLSAQYEHTVVITDKGAEILSRL